MKTCIIKSHLSAVWTQMGTHSSSTNRKTVGEQLHFSKRVIAALHNEVFNSFPTLANEYSSPDSPMVEPSSTFLLRLRARGVV